VQSYGERKVIFEIRKAENWLIAKNEVKKNYGAFFSNWIARSWRAESLPANQLPNDPPRNSQPEKPVSALEQRSEGFREQIRRKNLGLPNTIDGSYIPGVSE
jgi:hypothetical protein